MTPFYIFLATACAPIVVTPGFGGGIKENVCVQQLVRTSTSPQAQEGETAYRVIPATATVEDSEYEKWKICKTYGHNWQEFMSRKRGSWIRCKVCREEITRW